VKFCPLFWKDSKHHQECPGNLWHVGPKVDKNIWRTKCHNLSQLGGLNVTVTFCPTSKRVWTISFWTHRHSVQSITWTKHFWASVTIGWQCVSLWSKLGGPNINATLLARSGPRCSPVFAPLPPSVPISLVLDMKKKINLPPWIPMCQRWCCLRADPRGLATPPPSSSRSWPLKVVASSQHHPYFLP
jgi:hypothetical protein